MTHIPFLRVASGCSPIPFPAKSKDNAPMTGSRRTELIGSHPRAWPSGWPSSPSGRCCPGHGLGGGRWVRRLVQRGGPSRHDDHRCPSPATAATSGAGAAAGAGAATGGAPNGGTAGADAVKFSSCMRRHGVSNFPNPVITTTARATYPSRSRPARASIRAHRRSSTRCRAARSTCRRGVRARTSQRRRRRTM